MVKAHRNAPDPTEAPGRILRNATGTILGDDIEEITLTFDSEGELYIRQDPDIIIVPARAVRKFKEAVMFLEYNA